MDTQAASQRSGWVFALTAIVSPSLAGAGGAWALTHHPMITYVAFMTVWLFALIGAAFVKRE